MYICLTTCVRTYKYLQLVLLVCTFRRKGGDAVRMIRDNGGGTNGVVLFAATTKPSLTPTPYLEFVPHKESNGEIAASILVCMSNMQQKLDVSAEGCFH